MQNDAIPSVPQFLSNPAGQIETASRQDSVARVAALAGLTDPATEWIGVTSFTPTSVSITA